MRFKKMLTTFIVFALVSVFSQSAFALTGVEDTQENAISLFPAPSGPDFDQDIDLYLDSSQDKDWIKWQIHLEKINFLVHTYRQKVENVTLDLG
ncbi:hypothetical protein [Paenibacillus apiarius]|uniref:hypothetical protein n=1 Tax=Paenibacillus apiarius TaxID=46240 RepID=UPI003B3A9BA0